MRDTRGLASLVVACAAHLALGLVLRPPPPPSNGAVGEQEIDLTVIDSPIGSPTESADAPTPEKSRETSPSSSSKAKEVVRARPYAPSAAAPSDGVEAVKEGDSFWTFHSGPIDLGIGKPAQLGPADLRNAGRAGESVSPRDAPRPASTTGGVVESLDAYDVAHGFGRGGPARTAAEMATRDAAVMGSAVFGVTIDSALHVSVDLASVSSDYPGWARVAEDIKRTIIAKNVRIPSGAKGLRIAIRVEAKDQFPDGRQPKSLGGKVDVSKKIPGVTVGYSGKVCSGGLHVGLDGVGIGGGCSPENAGVPPVRIVSARIVDETRL